MKKITLGIEGMTCVACSGAIEKYLKKQPGIISINVNLVMANAVIEYDENILGIKQIETFIKQSGYKSTGLFKLEDENKKYRAQKIFFIIYGVLTVILLYISMGMMVGLPLPEFLDMHKHSITYASVLLGLTILFLIYGWDIFKNGIKTLFHLAPNMDTLVTLGVLSSLGYSIFAYVMIIKGNHDYVNSLYFESCSVIIYFIKLGRFIDNVSKNKTKQAIKELVQLTPNTAFVKHGNKVKQVAIDEIKKGDIVICHSGEKIAVDGKVVSGQAHIDEALITGESKPVTKAEGANVSAGSVNLDGYIEYSAERIGKDSTISEIVNLVVEATNTKMPIAKIADRVSGIFVPVVIAIAVFAFILYLCLGLGVKMAVTTFVTVLVVACPCSLGLATPLAIVISEGICAKNGILVKKSETLELASKADVVVFDKTGTLTCGKLKISGFYNFSNLKESEILKLACSLESKSTHPIGSAFNEKAKEDNLNLYKVTNFKNLAGFGIVGTINQQNVVMGNAKILAKFKIKNNYKDKEKELSQLGNSIVYLAIDNKIVSLFGVNDVLKDNAKEVVSALQNKNIEVIMLTGDNENIANIFATQLGIKRVIANVLPNGKTKIIKSLKKEGKIVIMCGDGINDSPALASADIGISVHNGTNIAMNSADVILMNDNLTKILDLTTISKKAVVNIKQNLFWAFFYNCLMIPIALGALRFVGVTINPMIAGLAMVLSSLTVVLNALRLKIVKLNKKEDKNV